MKINDMFSLNNKIAIITGGYGLYGCNISQVLFEASAVCIIDPRDLEKCRKITNEFIYNGYKSVRKKFDFL